MIIDVPQARFSEISSNRNGPAFSIIDPFDKDHNPGKTGILNIFYLLSFDRFSRSYSIHFKI